MKKLTALFLIISLFAAQLPLSIGISAAAGDITEVYNFDYTNSEDTDLWADGGVDQTTTGLKRSLQFSNENSMANITDADQTGKRLSYITYDSTDNGLRFRSKYTVDNGFHIAQVEIKLTEGATYQLITNARVTGTANTFDVMVTDKIADNCTVIPDEVNIYAQNNYTTNGKFEEKSVEFKAEKNSLYLTLRLQAVNGIMGRLKSIVINKVETEEDNTETVKELYNKYYHTFNFGDASLYTADENKYSTLFADENGKANVTNNGTVVYYTDGKRSALRLKANSAGTYTSEYAVELKPETEYVMAAYARIMTGGEFHIAITDAGGNAVENADITVDNTENGYYVTRFTSGSTSGTKLQLQYITTGSGSGILYNLSLYPLETSPVNGNFETQKLTGWAQTLSTYSEIPADKDNDVNGRNSYVMQMNAGSEANTYFLAKKGTNTAYMWIKNTEAAAEQTVSIYKMDTGRRITLADTNCLAAVTKEITTEYSLLMFDFVLDEDAIVVLNLKAPANAYRVDQIYAAPKAYAVYATFGSGLNGFRDFIAGETPIKLNDGTVYLNGVNRRSEAETVVTLKGGTAYNIAYSVKVENGGAAGTSDAKPTVMLIEAGSRESDTAACKKILTYPASGWQSGIATFTPKEDSVYRLALRCDQGSSAYFDDIAVYMPGDLNGDGVSDDSDVSLERKRLLDMPETDIPEAVYDINEDKTIDICDLVLLKKN